MNQKDKDYKQEQQETQAETQDIPSTQESVQGLGDSEQNLHAPAKKLNLPLPSPSPGSKDSAQYNPLSLYLREVNRFPTLEENEEFELGRRIRDHGDQEAAFRLATSHLRLVVKIAMEFQRKWMKNVLELIQEGNIGLMKAVQKFNPERGIKFSYYASFWIKAYILKFIMDNWRMVKIGTTQSQRKLFYNLGKEKQRLESQGFNADAETLSQNLDVSSADINEMTQRMSQGDLSLDSPFGEDSSTTRLDLLPALEASIEDQLAQEEISEMLRENINSILPQLNEKEKDILYSRLLASSPITLREIGDKYGITRERVRQIESRLLQKIKDHLASRIKDFSSEWISHE
ncbi:MAG: RNA polymerase sigma factor RpoD/SigA [Desulfohalobiaceae bacterium]